MFEAVYSANVVVVPYAFEGLVLLGAVQPDGSSLPPAGLQQLAAALGVAAAPVVEGTAEELCRQLLPQPAARPPESAAGSRSRSSYCADPACADAPAPAPYEGWVLELPDGRRTKLVLPAYKRMSVEGKLLHPLAVWDRIKFRGEAREQLLRGLPPHFRAELAAMLEVLDAAYRAVAARLQQALQRWREQPEDARAQQQLTVLLQQEVGAAGEGCSSQEPQQGELRELLPLLELLSIEGATPVAQLRRQQQQLDEGEAQPAGAGHTPRPEEGAAAAAAAAAAGTGRAGKVLQGGHRACHSAFLRALQQVLQHADSKAGDEALQRACLCGLFPREQCRCVCRCSSGATEMGAGDEEGMEHTAAHRRGCQAALHLHDVLHAVIDDVATVQITCKKKDMHSYGRQYLLSRMHVVVFGLGAKRPPPPARHGPGLSAGACGETSSGGCCWTASSPPWTAACPATPPRRPSARTGPRAGPGAPRPAA